MNIILTILALSAIHVLPTLCAPSQEESRSMTTDLAKRRITKTECVHTKNPEEDFLTERGFIKGGHVANVALFNDEGWSCDEQGWVKSLKSCEMHGPMVILFTQHRASCFIEVFFQHMRGVNCLDKLLKCGLESGVANLKDGRCVSFVPRSLLWIWSCEYLRTVNTVLHC